MVLSQVFVRPCLRPARQLFAFAMFAFAIFAMAIPAAWAQESAVKSNSPESPVPSTKQSKPKPTPEQEPGIHLLGEAQAEAPKLQPDMHAFVLWQISKSYAKVDRTKSQDFLYQGFLATLSLEDDPENCIVNSDCWVKGWLQQNILYQMLEDSPDEVEELLVRAEPTARTGITDALVQHNISKKNFSHAKDLLAQIADQPNYPYGTATKLILALPKERYGDCQAIFSQALANFNQFGSGGNMGGQDMGSLVLQTAKLVPPLALEAVDKLLDESKSNEKMQNMHLTLASNSKGVSLNFLYELRLFQLLPVLKELDSSRAESLLRDDAQMRNDLQNNPNGMGAFEPGASKDQKAEVPTMIGISTGNPSNAAQFQAQMQIMAEMHRHLTAVAGEADDDPQQALSDALGLPISVGSDRYSSPRAEALKEIAKSLARKNPKMAKSALDDLMKCADQLTDTQVQFVVDAPQSYLDLGYEEDAKGALKVILKKAEDVYAEDNDADDPNQAFKGSWPSTSLWQRCVKTAAKISPDLAREIIAGIPDSEIATFEKVAYANSLLGVSSSYSVSEHHKNSSRFMSVVQ